RRGPACWRSSSAWRRWNRSVRSAGRSSNCATSPEWSSPRSRACWRSRSARCTANGSAPAPSCRRCSTTVRLAVMAMDPDRLAHWHAADALFGQWLDVPGPERETWLRAQDIPDQVRRRLDQMIAAHVKPQPVLESAGGELAGRRLGDWTLEEELGRGGMAVVYR